MATTGEPLPPAQEPSTNLDTKAPAATSTTISPSSSSLADNHVSGPRQTPFPHLSASSQVPATSILTTEQETKYNSLLNTVASWASLPTSSTANAPSTALTETEQIWLTRDCLLRYLRATTWNISQSATRLRATLVWRREYGIYDKITSDYVSVENETGKQWILGYDNAGRPCHYLNPSRQNTDKTDRQIEHLVFMLERAIDLMPPGQETLALLMNFAETRSGQGATFQQGRQTLYILQHHYPERLGRALLSNLPWHINAFMKLVTPFIDPRTREKLVFNQPFRDHVPAEQLTKSHGGDVEFEYEHSVYWPAFVKLAEERRQSRYERWVRGGKMIGEFEMYLKGGQEESLRSTLNGDIDKTTEKIGDLSVGEKKGKMVAMADDGTVTKSPTKQQEGEVVVPQEHLDGDANKAGSAA